MSIQMIELRQGTQAWLEHRARHYNASDAASALGLSRYKTRQQLLREKATGIVPEIDAATQRRFDKGHEFEAIARPWAEEIIGAELFPVVLAGDVDGLPLSASLDGLTMLGDVAFEHKTGRADLLASLEAGVIPDEYKPQMEQCLLLSGATKCLFMASSGDREAMRFAWYESDPVVRKNLLAGWAMFETDLAEYQHVEQTVAPVSATIEALPALFVQVEGKVLASNLDAFKAKAQEFIDGIRTELETDQDFADADKMVKFLKDGEERLSLAKQQALAQTASIDELFRTVDAIGAQMRDKRLALEKLVKAEKENRKAQIITEARQAIEKHIDKLNERIGGKWMPPASAQPFADAIKGLKSLDSMRDKVSTALANAKIEANAIADTIQANRSAVPDEMLGLLFPDFGSVCTKSRADFANLLAVRVAAHREAEEKRLAERERIRQEEAAREAERVSREAPTANNLSQVTAAALDQATTGTGVLTISSDGVEHVPVASFYEAINQAGSQNPLGNLPADPAMITEFLHLQACSPATKKEMRTTIEKWEVYRAKTMAAAEEKRKRLAEKQDKTLQQIENRVLGENDDE